MSNSKDNSDYSSSIFNNCAEVLTGYATEVATWFNQATGTVATSIGYGSSDNNSNNSSDCDDKSNKGYPGAGVAAAFATTLTAYYTQAVGAAASLIGFGSPGTLLGSWAASIMSASATSGLGAGIVSFLQSTGALFVNVAGGSALVATGAIVVPGVVGYAAYQGYNNYHNRRTNKNEVLNE